MRVKLIAAVLGCLAAAFGLHTSPVRSVRGEAAPCQQELPPPRPVWEYTTARGTKDKPFKLNDAGAQGWELVTVIHDGGGSTFYFKRLRAD